MVTIPIWLLVVLLAVIGLGMVIILFFCGIFILISSGTRDTRVGMQYDNLDAKR